MSGDRGADTPRSLHASLLKAVAEDGPGEEGISLASGIATVMARRAHLEALSTATPSAPAAVRARATLSYDLALMRLCDTLELGHAFYDPLSPDAARAETEARLARRLPALAPDLSLPVAAPSEPVIPLPDQPGSVKQ